MELAKKIRRLALPVAVGILALIPVIMIYGWATSPRDDNNGGGNNNGGGEVTRQAEVKTDLCPGETHYVTFDGEWRRLDTINPALHCRIIAHYGGRVVYSDDKGLLSASGKVARNPKYARTISGEEETFVYSLCPPREDNPPVNWDCTPRREGG